MSKLSIAIDPPRPVSNESLLLLLETAHAQRPTQSTRTLLDRMLETLDEPGRVITLLNRQGDLSLEEELLLASAWLKQSQPDAFERGKAALERALPLAETDGERANVLAKLGKLETRLGNAEAAHSALTESLALHPGNKLACAWIADTMLRAGDAENVLAMVRDLAARGAAHPYLFAVQASALAQLGRREEADTVMGTGFRTQSELPPPPGWADLAAFHGDVVDELMTHPDLRRMRYGSDRELRLGVGSPLGGTPAVRLLLERIARSIEEQVAAWSGIDHPWLAGMPSSSTLHSSYVVSDRDDFERWHIHPSAWLNAVYYLQVPPGIANGETKKGCIAFGLPERLAGADARAYKQVIRPREGMLLLFPSHTYHRTYRHGLDARRSCLSFELRPA